MNFRRHISSKGTLFLAGKSAENNEELVKQAKPEEYVLHTAKPGSPFVNIKEKPKLGDKKEAAIFCARYSQDWRDNKSNVQVHLFKGKDIKKNKTMKTGCFGVKNPKVIKVKSRDIEEFEVRKE